MLDVVGTAEFAAWFEALPAPDAEAVTKAITILETAGVASPRVRRVEMPMPMPRAAKLALHELDVEARGLCVLFALDEAVPRSEATRAVLLYGHSDLTAASAGPALGRIAHHMLAARVYFEHKKASA